jgi:2-(1,2-epoxy-1,2-dihydrophenyl)acetyl-CoA isomerase
MSGKMQVIVFTGTGRAFCAGGNLSPDAEDGAASGFKGKGGKIPSTVSMAVRNLRQGMASSELFRNIDKPTIAAVNGACAGAGLAWACACDLRFAAEGAIFRSGFLTAGLSGDYGGTWTLPRIVGPAKAREMYLMNKKIGAEEAKAIHLVTDVFPKETFMASVMEIATEMASAPPLALKRIKQNLIFADANTNFSAALDHEAERHARVAYHPDAAEAGLSFMQKRKPVFKGLDKKKPWELSKL